MSGKLELPVPAKGSDAGLWRDVALQAIRAADLLANVAISRMHPGNETQVNEGLEVLQSVPGYWKLRRET
jgi:hypothetical protein